MLKSSFCLRWLAFWTILSAAVIGRGVTVDDLHRDRDLTPEKFAAYFSDFHFQLFQKVQDREVFLSTKTGDCDDYATLAADILKEKGYSTKLVVVFMPKDTHVVCYVAEAKCYLDFNRRAYPTKTVPSSGSLQDIADKVARSFGQAWQCVSEYFVVKGERSFLVTAFAGADR
jgi:hypothetical protein